MGGGGRMLMYKSLMTDEVLKGRTFMKAELDTYDGAS